MKANLSFILFFLSTLSIAQVQEGKASFYADKFEGRPTASGEKYKHSKLTAAHKTLPFGTVVRVTNTDNGKTVEVRINDRGPYVDGRIIDLSKSAAELIQMVNQGVANVKMEIIDAGDGKGGGPTIQNVENVRVEERELYEFSVTKVKAEGFGVQIGSYRELVNLVRLTDNLKSSYRKNVIVQVKVLNGIKVYTLIVGNFPNRTKAEAFKSKVTQRYPDAFIVSFANLK